VSSSPRTPSRTGKYKVAIVLKQVLASFVRAYREDRQHRTPRASPHSSGPSATYLDMDDIAKPRRTLYLEAACVEELAKQYQAKNLLNEENNARFVDHIDFVRNFEARAGTEGVGYRVMRAQFFANNEGMDRDLSDLFRVTFPPTHNAVDARPSALIETTDPGATNVLESLKTDGYWVSPVRVPDAILANVMPPFDQTVHETPGRDMVDEALLMQNRQIMDLWVDSFFLKIAERFFESAPILDFVVGMITNAGDTSAIKMSQDAMYYHSDKDRIRWLKAFIYLDDVGLDNGPHTYIAASQRRRLISRDGRYSDAEVRSVSPPGSEKVVTGPRGTFFLADTSCLHKGSIVRAGVRRVLQFEWTNSLFGAALHKVPMSVYRQQGVSTAFVEKYPRLFQRFV